MANGQQTALLASMGMAAMGVPPGMPGMPGGGAAGGLGLSFNDGYSGPANTGGISNGGPTLGINVATGRGTATQRVGAAALPLPPTAGFNPFEVSQAQATQYAYGVPALSGFDSITGDGAEPFALVQAGGNTTTYIMLGLMVLVILKAKKAKS